MTGFWAAFASTAIARRAKRRVKMAVLMFTEVRDVTKSVYCRMIRLTYYRSVVKALSSDARMVMCHVLRGLRSDMNLTSYAATRIPIQHCAWRSGARWI